MSGIVRTEDKLEYTFFPVKSYTINLSVKADHDAHIALSSVAGDSLPLVEIFLGGWNNAKSAIRFNKEKPDKAEANTPSICCGNESRTFDINFKTDGEVSVGLGDGTGPFLQWKNDTPFPINYFGVRTCWGASGDWVIDGGKNVHTDDSMEYTWLPVQVGRLDFEVKAQHDAHLALTSGPVDETPLYEIFLGGWGNAKCALRLNKEKPELAETAVDNIVNGDEFSKFWLKWNYTGVQVGRDAEVEPFLSYANHELTPILVTHFGIRTSWGADGHWKIKGVEGTEPEVAPAADPEVPAEPAENNEVGGDAGEEKAKVEVPEVEGVKWVSASGGEVPEGAFVGGEDNGSPLYVVRVEHEDAVIPGKLLAEHGVAYIPWGGEEHGKDTYEVLILAADAASFVDVSGDSVPENAVRGGTAQDGEALYIGRTTHEGALTVGKVHPSHGCLYISYGGAEISYPDYQILVKN